MDVDDGQAGRAPGNAPWSERYAETGGWPPPGPEQRRYDPGAHPPAAASAAAGSGGAGAGGDAVQGPTGTPPGAADPAGWHPGPAPGQPAAGGHRGPPTDARYAPPPAPWAPGDSAYGRLTGPRPAAPQPRRPTAPARVAGRTPVTVSLIVACVFVFLVQQADPEVTDRYGLLPAAVRDGQYERLITAAFLHAGLLHLATNMLTLYLVGAPLERVLRTGRYLTVYLLSALGGSLFSLWLSPAYSIGVGASGAIFGLFGALVVLRRQVGAEAGGLAVLIGLNLAISFAVPNISWQAHVGGLITGVLVALVLAATARGRRRRAAG